MTSDSVPKSTSVLIIGGGPGGAFAATVLAREGIDVVLLETKKFPRPQVGESQLASFRHFLRFIDLEDEFKQVGFQKKVGACYKMNKDKREGYTDFTSHDPNNYSWNVVRAQADEMLIRYAARVGAKVFEETKVTELIFDGKPGIDINARPQVATWENVAGETGSISFEYIIDASGRAGIISTQYLKNRVFNDDLRNVAIWGFWKGCGQYLAGPDKVNSPLFEALSDESGWTRYVPLHDGTVSVGVVVLENIHDAKRAAAKEAGEDDSVEALYHSQLKLAPTVSALLGDGKMIQRPNAPIINSITDYSYQAVRHAGPGYRLVGDAAAFIDPFFSSGVHLAFTGGLDAAASICAVRRGDCTEQEACEWHTVRTEGAYTRFLLVVRCVYQQIQAQKESILSEGLEDNFDRAFEFFRPIIQGNVDMNKLFEGDDMGKTIDYLIKHASAPSQGENGVVKGNSIQLEDLVHPEKVRGFTLRLERGKLGLDKVQGEVQQA